MINFQTIRNKQKWLFGLIAIPVIIGFVILFTNNAEEILLGQGRQSETELYGQLDGEVVTRDQWIEAQIIVLGPLYENITRVKLSGQSPRFPNLNKETIDNLIPNILAQKAMMFKYSIEPSKADAEKWLLDLTGQFASQGLAVTKKDMLDALSSTFGGDDQLLAYARHNVGLPQLQQLATISGSFMSDREAEIKFRNENELYEAEAIFLSHTNYLPLVQPTDEQLKNHYTNTLANHRISERRQVSYVTFPATNYLDEAEERFNELKSAQRESLLQAYALQNNWEGISSLMGLKTNGIPNLAKQIATLRTNEYKDMKVEEAVAAIRSDILKTPHSNYAGLAVVEAYKAGMDFQQSLEETYKGQPALNTLEKMALLQNLTATTSPLMTFAGNVPQALTGVTSADVFALSETNALIISSASFGSGDFFTASLKKVIPPRNRTFEEAKTTVAVDFKKTESIKLMNEAGGKIQEALKAGKALGEVGKENNLPVTKLGPFGSASGAIPGLANKANPIDVRTQALGLEVEEISELITSSLEGSDPTYEEATFVVKLTGKNAVSKDRFDAEFAEYFERARSAAAPQAYNDWLKAQTGELYKYSLKIYPEPIDGGSVVGSDGKAADGFYKLDTKVQLKAKPAVNFVFNEWSGAVTSNTGSTNNVVTVSRNSTVTATFIKNIFSAAEGGELEALKKHLERGVDLDAANNQGYTALHMAVRGGQKKAVALLLEKGANVNAECKGKTPLEFAGKNEEIAALLREKGGKTGEGTKKNTTK